MAKTAQRAEADDAGACGAKENRPHAVKKRIEATRGTGNKEPTHW